MENKKENVEPHLPLFRVQALQKTSNTTFGTISLVQSPSRLIVVGLTCLGVVLALIFAGVTSISRKARVSGVTAPVGGQVTVYASANAVISRNFVTEGQLVTSGTPMFEMYTERARETGNSSEQIAEEIRSRLTALNYSEKLAIERSERRRRDLETVIHDIDTEIEQLNSSLDIANKRHKLSEAIYQKYASLESSGYLTSVQVWQKQDELLDLFATIASVKRNITELKSKRNASLAEKNKLQDDLKQTVSDIGGTSATVRQQLLEVQTTRSHFVTAPRDGVVAAISFPLGQAVMAGQTLATLLPKDLKSKSEDLEVHLYVPSRFVGFLAKGQIIKLRYQAFPYQKFGISEGITTFISNAPLDSNALPKGISVPNADMIFKVVVSIKKFSFRNNDNHFRLKPGMLVEADIVQERRKVWEWVFAPFLNFEK